MNQFKLPKFNQCFLVLAAYSASLWGCSATDVPEIERVSALTASATGPIVVVNAAADTYVQSGSGANRSNGAATTIVVDANQKNTEFQGFMRFSVGDVGPIVRATLSLYVTNASTNSADVVQIADTTWAESITWNTKPEVTGPTVASIVATTNATRIDIDVTSVVAAGQTLSLALLPRSNDDVRFGSRESANPPQLNIEIEGEDPPPPPPPPTGGCDDEVLPPPNGFIPTCSWSNQNPAVVPPGRNHHMMSYDCHNHVTVMFGGINATSAGEAPGTFKKDVWHWTGSDWIQKADFPRTISRSAFAYDSHRHVFVSHGGNIDSIEGVNPVIGETWEYDAATDIWTQKSIGVGPIHPSLPGAMVYDRVRGVMVLVTENTPREANPAVWEYDGTTSTWTRKSDAPFASRSRHAMVFDGARTLLYGGKPAPEIGGNDFSDTWAYDGNVWTQIPNTGGIPRSRHTLVWDRTVNTAIVAYGTSSTVAADNVSLFVENQWRMTFSEPFNRNYHGMAYQNHTGNSVMFGGIGPTDNYTWTLTCAPSASNPVCGDLVCASNETCQTCATDCGRCPK